MMSNKVSTSALAKLKELEPKQLFSQLRSAGYINRFDDSWVLTEKGEKFGGEYVDHTKFGRFIVWPENLIIDNNTTSHSHLTATQVGERFKLNAKKINQLFKELGWLQKTEAGWELTALGATVGGEQKTHEETQNQFVVWHDSIVRNVRLKQTISEFSGKDAEAHSTDRSFSSFRQKFSAKHRTLDGHYVRSVGELLIDNWLYMNGVAHAYERQLPISDNVISDFYLPAANAYLQFWGDDEGATDAKKRAEITAIYEKHGLALIHVEHNEVDNLDSVLPPLLRPLGIHAY